MHMVKHKCHFLLMAQIFSSFKMALSDMVATCSLASPVLKLMRICSVTSDSPHNFVRFGRIITSRSHERFSDI
jgi:hypothetical protein